MDTVKPDDSMKRLSLPKKKRLVSNRQFKAVMDNGRRFINGVLLLYMAENDCEYSRLGVSVGKSRGNAVVRNRLKRLMREAFRQNQHQIPAGFDYVLMISPRWPKKSNVEKSPKLPTFEQIEASFLALVNASPNIRDS
ncbi:MAG: ribonuclease P protein component [Planctomycetota bacterium]|jgi:ribonuclease P protein component